MFLCISVPRKCWGRGWGGTHDTEQLLKILLKKNQLPEVKIHFWIASDRLRV